MGSKFSWWRLFIRLIGINTPKHRPAKSKRKRRPPATKYPVAVEFDTQRMPTVKFDMKRITRTVLADLERNVRKLPEVTDANFVAFYELAKHALPGDLYTFSKGIKQLVPDMTAARAAVIARTISAQSKGKMDRERDADIGIKKGRWRYANAPCMVDPGNPTPEERRRDAAHKAADGKVYVIAKGLLIDGKLTHPGDEEGCRCTCRSILPGFED